MSQSNLRLLSLVLPCLAIAACGKGAPSHAQRSGRNAVLIAAPVLGAAASFSVLGGETVTNTGPSTLSGDVGVSPGSAITGFPPGLVLPPGSIHAADTTAAQARFDASAAYDALAAEPCMHDLSNQNLGERTLKPGVYCFTSEALLTGTLVLDAEFDADAVFVFQITSKLVSETNASVRLINGASSCRVFWQVGSSATIGTGTSFDGTIIALTSIALETAASLDGRALALNGAVTLDNNQIRAGSCVQGTGEGLSCCFGGVACDGACVQPQTDANNCGACGKSCTASEVCSAGACTACPANRTQCTTQCADLANDPFNCGACGKVCGASQSCVAGSCGGCTGTVCSNSCVELSNDNANCGACGHACAADQCCSAGSCSATGPNGSCKQH